MRFLVSSPAEEDAATAIRHYNDVRPGLANDFLDELAAAYSRIRRWPFLAEIVEDSVRRVVLQQFHYYVFYRVERDTIHVLLLAPNRVDPSTIAARLRDFSPH